MLGDDHDTRIPIDVVNKKKKTLDSSELKEFADNNFKFDKNGRKLSK